MLHMKNKHKINKNAVFNKKFTKSIISALVVLALILTSASSVMSQNLIKNPYEPNDLDENKYYFSDDPENDTRAESDNAEKQDESIFPFLKKPGYENTEAENEKVESDENLDVKEDNKYENSKLVNLFSDVFYNFISRFPRLLELPLFQKIFNNRQNTLDESSTVTKEKNSNVLSIMDDSGDNTSNDGDIVVIPQSGSFMFMGQGSMDLDLAMDVNGTIVTIISQVFIGPDTSYVEVSWNVSNGHLEISSDGYFEFTELYLNIADTIILEVDSLIIDSDGYLLIDDTGNYGDISFNGVYELSGLNLDINNGMSNLTLSGSLDFSQSAVLDDLIISWGEDGFSADGSYFADSNLIINNFLLGYNGYFVKVQSIDIHGSTDFEFNEIDDTTVMCAISSTYLQITQISIAYQDESTKDSNSFSYSIDSITVNGGTTITLQVTDPDDYVTAEAGHIILSGNMIMSLNTVVELEDTTVEIQGDFITNGYNLNSGVEIWWNKTAGFFKIQSNSGSFKIFDLSISIDGTWVNFEVSKLNLGSDTQITIEQIGDYTNLQYQGSKTKVRGLSFEGNIQGSYLSLNIGSIYSQTQGTCYLNATWSTNGSQLPVIVEAYASQDAGISITGIDITYDDFSGSIGGLFLFGTWELEYNTERLWFKIDGSVQFIGYTIGVAPQDDSPVVSMPGPAIQVDYLYVDGILEMELHHQIIDITLSLDDATLVMGASPLGGFSISITGNAHVVINLVDGTFYGDFGVGGSATIMGLQVAFSVDGDFYGYIQGDSLGFYLSLDAFAHTYMPISMEILGININLGLGVSVAASCTVEVLVNFSTGQIDVFYSCIAAITVNVNIQDIDQDVSTSLYLGDFGEFLLEMELEVDFELGIVAHAIAHISNNGLWISVTDAAASGTIEGSIKNLKFQSIDTEDIQVLLTIDDIYFDVELDLYADLGMSLSMPWFIDADLELNSAVTVTNINFEFSMPTYTESHPSSGVTIYDYEGDISVSFSVEEVDLSLGSDTENIVINFYMDKYREGSAEDGNLTHYTETRITFEGDADISITNFDFEGHITRPDIGTDKPTVDVSGHIGDISVELDDLNFQMTKIDSAVWVYDDEPYGHWEYPESTTNISIEGNATVTIEDFDISATINENMDIGLTWDNLEISFGGTIDLSKDGTINIDCEIEGNIENLYISALGQEIYVDSLSLEFGGEITIYPPDQDNDKPAVIDIDGKIDVDGDLDGDGESDVNGTIYVDGRITVDWEKDEEGNWMIDVIFDSTDPDDDGVYIEHFDLNIVSKDKNGEDFPIDLSIDNYHGTGMIEFRYNGANREIYLNNQMDAEWDNFYIDIKDGALTGEINQFSGDITLSDITAYIDPENNGNPAIEYGMHSGEGYQTFVGFSFASNTGFDLEGEITTDTPQSFSILEIHLDSGTQGDFYFGVDRHGDWHIHLEVTQGQADITLSASMFSFDPDENPDLYDQFGDSIDFVFSITADEMAPIDYDLDMGAGFTDFGGLVRAMKDFVQQSIDYFNEYGEWPIDILLSLVEDMSLLEFLESLGIDVPEEWINASGSDSCFLAGTQIEMIDGTTKDIEDICIGDKVVSFDTTDEIWKSGTVSYVFHHSPEEMTDYYLLINNDLRVTPNHPVFVNGRQITADELNVGDKFGGNIISSIKKIYGRVPTYNFEVEPYHTYNVVWGDNAKSLVHNANQSEESASSAIMTKYTLSQALTMNMTALNVSAVNMSAASLKVANSGMPLSTEGLVSSAQFLQMTPKVSGFEGFSVSANSLGSYDLKLNGATVAEDLNIEEVGVAAQSIVSSYGQDEDSSSSAQSANASQIDVQPIIFSSYDDNIIDLTSSPITSGSPLDVPVGFDGKGSAEVSLRGLSADSRIFVVEKYGYMEALPHMEFVHPPIPPVLKSEPVEPITVEPVDTYTNSYSFDLFNTISLYNDPYFPPTQTDGDGNDGSTLPIPDQNDTDDSTVTPVNPDNDTNNESDESEQTPTLPDQNSGCGVPLNYNPFSNFYDYDKLGKYNSYWPVTEISKYDIIQVYNTSSGEMDTAVVSSVREAVVEKEYIDIVFDMQGYREDQDRSQQFFDEINQLRDCMQDASDIVLGGGSSPFSQYAPYLDIAYPEVLGEHILSVGPEQLVYTKEDGFKEAESIQVGDTVLTKEGYKTVQLAEINERIITTYTVNADEKLKIPDSSDEGKTDLNDLTTLSDKYSYNHLSSYTEKPEDKTLADSLESSRTGSVYFADGILVAGKTANKNITVNENQFISEMSDGTIKGNGFTQGTMIKMADGSYKDISSISYRDEVKAYDEATNTMVDAYVTNVECYDEKSSELLEDHGLVNEYLSVELSGFEIDTDMQQGDATSIQDSIVPTGETFELELTKDQWVYVLEKPELGIQQENIVIIPANDLGRGYVLITENNDISYVRNMQKVTETVDIYSIKVDEYHNYFADDVLVSDGEVKREIESDASQNDDSDDYNEEIGGAIQLSSYKKTKDTQPSDNQLYFEYYKPVEYGIFSEETAEEDDDRLTISDIFNNFIVKIATVFPVLEKIPFIHRIIQEVNSEEQVDDDNNNDDSSDDSQDTGDDNTGDDNPDDGTGEEPVDDGGDSIDDEITNPIPGGDSQLSGIMQEISANPDNIHYIWDYGDGTLGYGINPDHTYNIVPASSQDSTDGESEAFSSSTTHEITYDVKMIMLGREGNLIDVDTTTITMKVPFEPVLPPENPDWTSSQSNYQKPTISYKSIEDLTEDDTLITYDQTASYNEKIETSDVADITHKTHSEPVEYTVIEYEILNSDAPSQTVKVMPYQPVFVRGEYKPANQVQTGNILYTIDEEKAAVISVTQQTAIVDTCEIHVLNNHNFYVEKILLGDSTKLDISEISEDVGIIRENIGVLSDQSIAVESVAEIHSLSSSYHVSSYDICF